ncbi:unnamed protein product [Ceratitis capitata]|uniref:(Mediterranean fruit fly) hypothetical protein n=1 Tax=Ceratitis capitata TaxID=7213 RepID=A0A811ULX5_CERCA|nr:unnamed protein product [Ceratitis capitata]
MTFSSCFPLFTSRYYPDDDTCRSFGNKEEVLREDAIFVCEVYNKYIESVVPTKVNLYKP